MASGSRVGDAHGRTRHAVDARRCAYPGRAGAERGGEYLTIALACLALARFPTGCCGGRERRSPPRS